MNGEYLSVAATEALMRRRKSRNRAVLLVLLGLVALFYVITIVRIRVGN
ncbi:MAG TPA: hypothetical protein VNT30_16720 [Stellaceae bacterium]|nr:hypothetical protein [Stellaceae bacterium]